MKNYSEPTPLTVEDLIEKLQKLDKKMVIADLVDDVVVDVRKEYSILLKKDVARLVTI